MRQSHRLVRLLPLLLVGVLTACDQRSPQLPTGAQVDVGEAGLAPLLTAGQAAVPGRYIVVLHDAGEQTTAAEVARSVTSAHGGRVHHTYRSALNGFAATLPPAAVEALRRNPQVAYVAEDVMSFPSQVTQPNATWGLDRVDQRDLPLNGTYVYSRNGTGVRVYVIDSGIRTAHDEFGGRASVGMDFVGDGRDGQDCSGHGTHVSGTIAGSTYGVAKNAQVISVRVFPCSGGTLTSTVIAAVDWVRLNAVRPAVVNYSGGGLFNSAHNQAVQTLIASGVTYVTAAGNSGDDACYYSPASTPEAITVASSTSSDARSFFSNWGSCVDVFAPGSDITSAWSTSNTATNTISGTSMASPHVAGVAALYLQGSPTATPATVAARILASSSADLVTSAGTGSPNRLLFSTVTPPPPGAAIELNPGSLLLTFVRPVPGAATAQMPAAAPSFASASGGVPKAKAAAAPVGHEATLSTTVSGRVTLLNTGTAALNWTAASNRAWLSLDPAGGQLNAGFSARLAATVNSATLAAGDHHGTLTVADPQATSPPGQVNVTVSVVEPTILRVGTPLTGLSGAIGSEQFYAVQVPTGATSLRIATSGGTGDADLRVRYGAIPTWSESDCVSREPANEDACEALSPPPGTYYVMVQGWHSYQGLTLSATSGGVPAAPLNTEAQPVSATSIQLTWTDGSANESGFPVQRRALAAGVWGAWAEAGTAAANAVSFTSTGLAAGGTYQHRLRACNVAGCSTWAESPAATLPTAPPAPPFGLRATATSGRTAAVTWTDGSGNETGFLITRSLRNPDGTWASAYTVARPAVNASSFNDGGLLAGRQYRYQMVACNPAGCSRTITSNVLVMPVVPQAPPLVSATPLNGGLRVEWTDGGGDATSFQLSRAAVSSAGVTGAWVTVATLPADQVRFDDTGLVPGLYQYGVRACNLAGCSAPATSPVMRAASAPPAAPSGLTATATAGRTAALTWTDGSGNETGFLITRSLRNPDGTWTSAYTVGRPGVNATSFNDSGLLAGRQYRYQMVACNLAGCSRTITSNVLVMPHVPPAPLFVSAAPLSGSAVQVQWRDASSDETSFQLSREMTSTTGVPGAWVNVATLSANQVRFDDTGLAPGVYRYGVRACNLSGCSATTTTGAGVAVGFAPPAPPSGLTATATSGTTVAVTWTDESGNETGFVLTRSLRNPDGTWASAYTVAWPAVNTTSITDGGVQAGRQYRYQMVACNPAGCSRTITSNVVTTPAG